MPPAAKRRKPNATAASKQNAVAPSSQRGIQGYGRISKAQLDKGKSNAASKGKDALILTPATPEDSSTSRKRKASGSAEDTTTQAVPTKRLKSKETIGKGLSGSKSVLGISQYCSTTPKTPRKNVLPDSIPIETSTKGARQHLESLDLISSPCSERQSTPSLSHVDTPPSSPVHPDTPEEPANQVNAPVDLPEELQDLIDLHSSFLTALSLHFTHHGSLTPADFRILRPNIERSWRKRRVKIQDIQRILAVSQTSSAAAAPTTLSLADYGHSKICIEISTRSEQLLTPQKRLLNEELFNATFATNLQRQWKTFTTTSKPASGSLSSVEAFINSLPLLPITPCTSSTVLAPLLLKGQRRLEDLKAGAIRAQARCNLSTINLPTESSPSSNKENDNNAPAAAAAPTITKANATPLARKSSLFDRIKQKQAAREASSSSTTPLTPTQRLRLAALHRVEEIVPVLELLVSSSSSSTSSSTSAMQIKSFTMPTIVQYLQMSLRNPIETEVAVRAVRLLAEEVGPRGWMGVREVGRILGVTVRRGGLGMVGGRGEVGRRVREAIARGA
ncbi:MAG: hypothetical protein LQ350_000530 [Teloschistes chrysophthalmus]|nr:MAG: hypothetical protein LQ350_000530 [Niorma chrysophthalma]